MKKRSLLNGSKINPHSAAVTATFILLVAGCSAVSLFTPDKLLSETENRTLEQRPKLSAETLLSGEFTEKYELYMSDQFFLRDKWVALRNYSEIAMLKRELNGVYLADDGYLITRPEINVGIMEKNTDYILRFAEKCAADLGPEHVRVLIAPTAAEVLREKLPPFSEVYDQSSLLDSIAAALPDRVFCNVLPRLDEHSSEYIYYRTDHHWTTLGAYYAYTEYCDSIGIKPSNTEDFRQIVASDSFLGTLASKVNIAVRPDELRIFENMNASAEATAEYDMNPSTAGSSIYAMQALSTRDKYSFFLNGNRPIVDITAAADNGRTLMVIKDSYANCFVPFLTEHFERIIVIDLRYFNADTAAFAASEGVTDMLILYNAEGLSSDSSIVKLGRSL